MCAESEPLGDDARPAWGASLRSCRRSAFRAYNDERRRTYHDPHRRIVMTGRTHRPPVSDRARRRAIRAYAARLGVPYSLAARLLGARAAGWTAARVWADSDEH